MTVTQRPSLARRSGQNKARKYSTLINTVVFVAMGFVYMLPLTKSSPTGYFPAYLIFTFLFSVITFMLITDFSNVLFDARDKYILFPRPVGDRTLVLARMLHVFIYPSFVLFCLCQYQAG